jgi:hypothetical protein
LQPLLHTVAASMLARAVDEIRDRRAAAIGRELAWLGLGLG